MWTRRRTRERELSAELQSHLDMHTADNLRAGMTQEEARRQALIALGGVQQTKERYREQRKWRVLEELARDATFAVRMLMRDRGFTIAAAAVLGIGLAVTNTFFIMAHSILVRGLPIDEPDRVIMLRARDAADRNLGMSYPDYLDIRASAQSFTGIGAFTWAPMTLGDDAHTAERFVGEYVSSDVFSLIGERPIAGRDFQPQDDAPGAPPVVILGRSIWESRYGGSAALIGSTLRVNGVPATVVGIMPDRSKFPSNAVVWQPLGAMPASASGKLRGSRQLDVFGRLKPGASRVDAIGELQGIWSELIRRYPATNANIRLRPIPINHHYVGESIHPAWYAFIAAGFLILFVACANVANLLIMRGTHRAREIAVRASLGATRTRIVRQLLAESIVLACVGGAIGLALSTAGAHLLWTSQPEGMPHWMQFTMDPPVFGLLAAVCVGSAFVFGLFPAFHTSKRSLIAAMSTGNRGTGRGVPSRRLTSALLIAQFSIALGSLISISAMARAVADDYGITDGDARGLLTMSIALPGDRYGTPESRVDFYDRLHRHFEQVDGVMQMALTSNLPLGGAATRALILDGQDVNAKGPRPTIRSVSISPEYFETLRVPLLRGRQFTHQDGIAEPTAVIINQRLADLYFQNTEPVGKLLTVVIDSAPRRFTIVGVSPTIKQRPGPQTDPVVYFPHRATAPTQMALMVRSVTDRASTAAALRTAMQSFDADVPLHQLMTLQESLDEADWNGRFSNMLAGIAGILAVLLSAIGLFALTAHAVVCMTPEIGIRAALGARPHQVLNRVLRSAALQLALGIIAGIAFALIWNRIFSDASAPSNTGPIDFVVAALMLAAVSAIACLVPALRALRVNPLVALRYE